MSLPANAALSDINRIYQQIPALHDFEVCTGGGCAEVKHVSLTDDEWQSITSIFMDARMVFNAEQERDQIALAIGAFESIVGRKTSTETDLAGTFGNSDYPGQLDCNDEAINSTTYMRLMRQNGLLKFHEIEDTRTRNFFFTGWPHSTAVIHETASGERFAVDSWFYDNGFPATIVPFNVWKSGYIPEDSPVLKK
ncbi:MAG TPA: hypothetical protein VIO56_06515 [Methylotenera sp.]